MGVLHREACRTGCTEPWAAPALLLLGVFKCWTLGAANCVHALEALDAMPKACVAKMREVTTRHVETLNGNDEEGEVKMQHTQEGKS